jgi:hypothetical protein
VLVRVRVLQQKRNARCEPAGATTRCQPQRGNLKVALAPLVGARWARTSLLSRWSMHCCCPVRPRLPRGASG